MKLLLISNSTNYKENYLGWCLPLIKQFFKRCSISGNIKNDILFIPYAGVNIGGKAYPASYDAYASRIKNIFEPLGYHVTSIHEAADPIKAVNNASTIIVGGGNTFHLVAELHKHKLIEPIRRKVMEGTPYIGWSAGSNVACPTLMTTNDMPIIMPECFKCLDLVPFQINPHYIDAYPEEINDAIRHGGETRQVRIDEFLAVNQEITVAGLREATALWVEGDKMCLKGERNMRVMRYNGDNQEFKPRTILDFNFKECEPFDRNIFGNEI